MAVNWGSLIGTGLELYGAKKGQEAQANAARDASNRAMEAARPKSVYGLMSQAYYDPETESYQMGLSPEAQGLMSQQMGDTQAFRNQRNKLMGDPEAVALRRARETISSLEPQRQDRYNKSLSNLYGRGLATSSMGSQAMSDLEALERAENIRTLQSSRGEVSGEIGALLNRENSARQGMMGLAALPQNLANIGTGIGSNLGTAAIAGMPSLNAAGKAEGNYLSNLYGNLGGRAQGLLSPNNEYDKLQSQEEALMNEWGI
jgi:hypothetical protein